MPITAHVLVRNDERYVGYAILSVIDYVEKVIVFDTGSTDETPAIVERLALDHPRKILFERKGPADSKRHTRLRQEMLDRTDTSWFMILDGDEVWPRRAIEEAVGASQRERGVEFVLAPFYTCVGDVFHDYVRRGGPGLLGQSIRMLPRLGRLTPGLRWQGDYGHDVLVNAIGRLAYGLDNSVILRNRYWHMTHLERSSSDRDVYSSGGTRADKRRPTYVGIGRRISEPVPEVFDQAFLDANRMGLRTAVRNLVVFACDRVRRAASGR